MGQTDGRTGGRTPDWCITLTARRGQRNNSFTILLAMAVLVEVAKKDNDAVKTLPLIVNVWQVSTLTFTVRTNAIENLHCAFHIALEKNKSGADFSFFSGYKVATLPLPSFSFLLPSPVPTSCLFPATKWPPQIHLEGPDDGVSSLGMDRGLCGCTLIYRCSKEQ